MNKSLIIIDFVKCKVEELLLSLGFTPAKIMLATKTIEGQEYLECYKYNETYCQITCLRHNTVWGEMKDWVLIEYANSLYEAQRWMFEDGDMIPLDIPIEQILSELKEEIVRDVNINS